MSRFRFEAAVRWLDELDAAFCTCQQVWHRRRLCLAAGGRISAKGLTLVAGVLLLGPSIGI